jgi:hypothetical protein
MIDADLLPGNCQMRSVVFASLVATFAAPTAMAAPAVTPAAPQNCVQLSNIRETRVIDNKTIDFVMSDGRVLRNTLPSSCPQLGFNKSFGYETAQSQLCNVDIITVIVQGGGPRRGASCGLGQFTPIATPAK